MADFYIPTPTEYKEIFNISLENISFQFLYQYNSRSNSWWITITSNNFTLLEGVKLTQGIDLFYERLSNPLKGRLIVKSLIGDLSDPNLSNFGKSVFLFYVSP